MPNPIPITRTVNPASLRPQSAPSEALTIRIQLDKIRTLIFDSNAQALLEEKTGLNILTGEFVPNSVTRLRLFIWACLQTSAEGDEEEGIAGEGPISETEVGSHIMNFHFKEVLSIVMRLMTGVTADPMVLAPFVPSDHTLIERALEVAKPKAGETLFDLGCGDGRVLAVAARRYGMKVRGIEKDKNRVRIAKALMAQMGVADWKVTEGLIQEADVSRANVIFLYLLHTSNDKIKPLLETAPTGTRIVSHDFLISGWTPSYTEVLSLQDRNHSIYVYTLGEHLKPESEAEEINAFEGDNLTDAFIETYVQGVANSMDLPAAPPEEAISATEEPSVSASAD